MMFKLFAKIKQPLKGIYLEECNGKLINYSGDPIVLLQGICDTFPRDSVLYLESPKDICISNLLRQNHIENPSIVQVGTLWPRDESFHIKNEEAIVRVLVDLAKSKSTPIIADHLVVYKDDTVLLSAYDLGDKEIWVNKELDSSLIQQLLIKIRGKLVL